MKRGRVQGSGLILIFFTVILVAAGPGHAQSVGSLVVRGPDQETRSLQVTQPRGYATVGRDALEALGLSVETNRSELEITMYDGGPVVRFSFGSPLFWWDDDLLQLVDVPFAAGGTGQRGG